MDRNERPDDLVARLRDGDEDAFRALIDEHRPAIRAAFLGMGASAADADDLTQDVFVRAMHAIDELRDPSRLGPWLFGIVRNLRLQYLRRRSTRRQAPLPEHELPGDDPDPLASALTDERRLAVQGALTRLDDAAQELIRLRFARGLSYREIAARLGLTVDNVGVRLHRINRRLREALGRWSPAE